MSRLASCADFYGSIRYLCLEIKIDESNQQPFALVQRPTKKWHCPRNQHNGRVEKVMISASFDWIYFLHIVCWQLLCFQIVYLYFTLPAITLIKIVYRGLQSFRSGRLTWLKAPTNYLTN